MKLAFFGDVVGRAGREAVKRHLPRLKGQLGLDAVVINAENAQCGLAGGTLPIKSDGNHDARGGKQILVNLSFEVGAGIKRTTVRTEPAP